jgi:RimJ/RimL family protein N-acetyltransferase
MRLIHGHNQTIAAFVASMIPRCRETGFSGNCTAIGVADGSATVVGGFVYHNYDPDSLVIEISAASTNKRWLTRPVLYALFGYPFLELGCQMVYCQVSERNKPLLRICKGYGFSQIEVPRWFGRDEACILNTLTVEAWMANGFHKENAHG